MALPNGNNSNNSNQRLPQGHDISNPFDDDEDEEYSAPTRPAQTPSQRPAAGLPAPRPTGIPVPQQSAQPPRRSTIPVPQPARDLPTAAPRPTRRPAPPPVEEFEFEEEYEPVDDAFEPMPVDEVYSDSEFEEFEEQEDFAPPAPRRGQSAPPQPEEEFEFEEEFEEFAPPSPTQSAYFDSEPEPRFESSPKEDEEESNFVNKTKKQLLPFGGSKSKLNVDDYDKRANRKAQSAVVQWGVIAALIGTTGFGIWNAVNPPTGVSLEEVYAIAQHQSAQESFPLERGAAFAENFMAAFLEINPDLESAFSDPLLGYYYTGALSGGDTGYETPLQSNENFGQKLLTPPRVIKTIPSTANGASYVVAALVEKYDKASPPVNSPGEISPNAKWVYFSINVYYNADSDSMSITPESPILTSPVTVAPSSEAPAGAPPGVIGGDRNPEVKEQVVDLIPDFFNKWAEASIDSHSSLNTVIVENPPSRLVSGFGGQFKVSPDSTIEYEVYNSNEAGVYVAEAHVDFVDELDSLNKATYSGVYFVEMVSQGGGKYLVKDISPKDYYLVNNENAE